MKSTFRQKTGQSSRKKGESSRPQDNLISKTDFKQMETALQESNSILKALLDAATHAIFLMDTSGIILAINAFLSEQMGHKPSEMLGRCIYDFLPADVAAARRVRVQEVVRTGSMISMEDQSEGRWFGSTIYPVIDVEGRVTRLAVFSGDITEHKRTEEKLREREERFRSAFDRGAVPMVMTALDSRLIVANSAFSKMLGYSESELVGLSFYDFTHPDDIEINKPGIDAVTRGDKDSFRMEKRYIRKDGQIIWVDMSTSSVRDTTGKPLYLVTHAQDITERKRAEEALRESEARYRTLYESLNDAFVQVSMNGRIIECNDLYCRMLGHSLEELKQLSYKELTPERWHAFEEDIVRKQILERGYSDVYEKEYRRKDGTVISVELRTILWRDAAGRPSAMWAIVRDITERKQAEETIARSKRRITEILESIQDGFYTIDREWCFSYLNRRSADNLGVRPEDLIGENVWEKFPQIIGTAHEVHSRRAMDLGEVQHYEMFGVLTDKWYNISVYPSEEGISIYWQDVTERKRIEEAVQKAKDDLEIKVQERTAQLTEVNESLLAEIDVRKRTEAKLLSAQKNLRAMASEVIIAEERSRQHFATDLHDTVVQTLGAAKLRAQLIEDQIPRKAQPIFADLQALLSESILQSRSIMAEMSPPVLKELGLIPALEWLTEQIGNRYGMDMNFKGKKGNKPVSLPHEIELLLFQATRELLMNVVKHSGAQTVTVKFSSRSRKVRIEVSDNGMGFDIKRTFQPDLKGGFGIYTIRERLRHIGGQLVIKSKPGEGTTVLVRAPIGIES